MGVGMMAEMVPLEDLDSIPSSCMAAHNPGTPFPGDQMSSCDLGHQACL